LNAIFFTACHGSNYFLGVLYPTILVLCFLKKIKEKQSQGDVGSKRKSVRISAAGYPKMEQLWPLTN
jgi:hypothetical protein